MAFLAKGAYREVPAYSYNDNGNSVPVYDRPAAEPAGVPELPEPHDVERFAYPDGVVDGQPVYTADQLRTYGQQCHAAGREQERAANRDVFKLQTAAYAVLANGLGYTWDGERWVSPTQPSAMPDAGYQSDRDQAIQVWHKHCDAFASKLGVFGKNIGVDPPSCVINAMIEFALLGRTQGMEQAKAEIVQAITDPDLAAYATAAAAQPAQASQEAMAWARQCTIDDDDGRAIGIDEPEVSWGAECPDPSEDWSPLYAAPARAAMVPLTRSQINKLSGEAQVDFCLDKQPTYEVALARAIERAHGIGGTTPADGREAGSNG